MRVKRLKMQSFRGIGDLTLEFPPDEPTVFIGINGVGKSTILDCIAILLSPYINLIKMWPTVPKSSFSSFDELKQQKRQIKLNPLISQFYEKENNKNGQAESQIEITILTEKMLDVKWLASTIKPSYIELLQQIYEQCDPNFSGNIPLAIYYPVNRGVLDITLDISEQLSFNKLDAYDSALTGGQIGFNSFFQWFRTLEDLENEERRDDPDYRDRRLEAVRDAIKNLIEEFLNLRVRRSPLRMTVEKQGQEFILNQLSDGEKCLLAMVGDLARRLALANPNLKKPLEGAGVVLIDEIELHLHPEWQREIMPKLTSTFPNCQFIVTTHSPQVLSQVKPESIYILERTEEGEIIAKRPKSSFGRDSNRILEDSMGVPERPLEIKNKILKLFQIIDSGDIEAAQQLRQELADEIGSDEPEFVRADILIRRKEILNK
ncbi:AAA family ATPase [Microcoleus sp. FACHB-68]|uniref:AAA family ATPase n=1 Tax=Microcoleus sp. FACHB-68 TaxID=2692826 RepID=UPI001683D71C|nr:AAA family ATPase [Microcoleus sp. FACHB-68]MBD1939603.1 AAA family ATPase [Microcoleus sp. FACHB-68]